MLRGINTSTKITEDGIYEMHANKRHGYAIEVGKFHNGEMIVVTSRNLHNFKIFSIKYLDIGRILNDNGTLSYFRTKMDLLNIL